MQRRIVLVLVLASVIGLVASMMVYRVLVGVAAQTQATQPVVVAAVNLSLAETITPKHVKVVGWPKTSVPSGVITSLEEAEGRVVRGSIVAGEPLLESKLAPHLSGRGGIMPMLVPDGLRAVTIKVDDAVRESGFVLPNSRVDVLVSMPDPGSQGRISKVILQDVLVLAAGQTVELRDNKPVTVTTVTLALDPGQVERLTLAQAEGRLTFAMRNLRDNRVVRTQGVTAASLLSDGAPAVAAPAVRPAARPRAAAAPAAVVLPPPKIESHAVAVLRGNKLAEHVFTRDGDNWVERAEK